MNARLLLLTLLLTTIPSTAGEKPMRVIIPGAKIFIAPMESGLDGFLAPEMIKRKLPVTIVADESIADYVLSGNSIKADDKWYNTIFNGKDKNEGNVRLLNVQSKSVIWAGEAGDRSLWWGSLKRGGQRKVAERLVKQMTSVLFPK